MDCKRCPVECYIVAAGTLRGELDVSASTHPTTGYGEVLGDRPDACRFESCSRH